MANTSASAERLYMQLNASELSAIIMKGSPNSNDRDAGFCSGSSEVGDDLSIIDHSRLEPSSPTDASEDSVEVKVTPISLCRNKRKSSEPSKVIAANVRQEAVTGPLKKRIRYSSGNEAIVASSTAAALTTTPPAWDPSQRLPHELMPNPAQVYVRHPGATTLHRIPDTNAYDTDGDDDDDDDDLDDNVQDEPLALVLKKPSTGTTSSCSNDSGASSSAGHHHNISHHNNHRHNPHHHQHYRHHHHQQQQQQQQQQVKDELYHSDPNRCDSPVERDHDDHDHLNFNATTTSPSLISSNDDSTTSGGCHQNGGNRPQQRNYKNMTRERRIEANARERTRVHTISAAYETLRKAVPAYSNSQKLSKLSVLRVACSYILTLSRMAGEDYSEDQSEPSIASCMDSVTATIQTEGKIRKKKDD